MNERLMIAFIAFLLVNLLLGLYKGRNVKTMKDYALANRSMGTGTLMITIFATVVEARYVTSTLISAQNGDKGILNALFAVLGFSIGALFLGRVVFPKLVRFKQCYTLGDIIGVQYGPKAQLFTGIISVFFSIMIIAGQFIALNNIAAMLEFDPYVIIGLVGLAVILYTFSGGMRAVAATDILQFALVMGGFAFIAYQVFGLKITENGKIKEIDSIGTFFNSVKQKATGLKSNHLTLLGRDGKRYFSVFVGAIENNLIFFTPPIINRILAARNRPQIRQAFTGFAVFYPILRLVLLFIGFGLFLTYGFGEGVPKISELGVFSIVEEHLFQGNSVSANMVKFILMMTFLGVIMSTSDSYLNALVVVVVRDILQYKQPKEEGDRDVLKHVKKIALSIGVASILLSYCFLYFKAFPTTISYFAQVLFGCFGILLVAAAFKLKGNAKTFFASMSLFLALVTLVSVVFLIHDPKYLAPYFRSQVRFVMMPILMVTAIAFLLIHKKVYGRLTWEKPEVKDEAVRRMGGTKKKWRTIFLNPLVWAKDTLVRYGNEPTAVGFFVAMTAMVRVTIFPRFHADYTMIFTILNICTVLLAVLLMLHVMWPKPFKGYFSLFYYGALIYTLPFMHMLLFLYQPMSILLLIQLAIAMVLLHLLVDWRSYCLFTFIGWGIAGIVYLVTRTEGAVNAVSEEVTITSCSMVWLVLVTLASISGLGFLFCSRQEQINTQRLMRTKTYAAGFGHDLLNLYQCPQSTIDYVQHAYKQGSRDSINEAQEWEDMARYMQECTAQAHAFKKLVKFDYIPQSEMRIVSMMALMEKAYGLIPSFRRDGVRIVASQDFEVEVFPPFVNNIILNLVKNAQKHGNAEEVVLSWDAATRRLYIKDNGSGISSHIASKIGDLYTTATQDGTGNGIGLAFVFMVVEDIFNAQIDFETSDKGTTFWIEFPPIKRK